MAEGRQACVRVVGQGKQPGAMGHGHGHGQHGRAAELDPHGVTLPPTLRVQGTPYHDLSTSGKFAASAGACTAPRLVNRLRYAF